MGVEFTEQIMEYLTPRRMASLKNLADQFGSSLEDIVPSIKDLETGKRLRIALSRCSSDCGSCSSCGSDDMKAAAISETSIVISLER